MGARSGGGGTGYGRRQATFQKGMASLQSQYDAARKTYNNIKKELGGKNKVTSVGYYAAQIMKKQDIKTPSEIKQQMHDYAKNFNWGF